MGRCIGLFVVLLIAFSAAKSQNQGSCSSVLPTVTSAVNQKLANEGLPNLYYECVRGGSNIAVSANSVTLVDIEVSRIDESGYINAVSGVILSALRGSWYGLSEDGSNNRHASNNQFIDSSTAKDIKLRARFDVAAVVPASEANPDGLLGARINGPLGFVQASESTIYAAATLHGWETYVGDPTYLKDGFIVAIWRSNFTLRWVRRYSEVSTEAKRKLARMYPNEYNVTKVDNWHRNVTATPGGSFSPFSLTPDGLLITGDNSPTYELLTSKILCGYS